MDVPRQPRWDAQVISTPHTDHQSRMTRVTRTASPFHCRCVVTMIKMKMGNIIWPHLLKPAGKAPLLTPRVRQTADCLRHVCVVVQVLL